jgi:hypothetical protein
MHERRLRLGDVLDDYCPRERRITNHVVVAMIEDEVKQTRCSTCDADHEYKNARVPPPRRKKPDSALADTAEAALRPKPSPEDEGEFEEAVSGESLPAAGDVPAGDSTEASEEPVAAADVNDDGPVHRRLIRATLPRPEGQTPERKEPEFTIRQPGGRGRDFNRPGQRPGRRGMRAPGSGHGPGGQPPRHGSGQGPRQGGGQPPRHGSGQGPGGNRPGQPGGHRGNRPGPGQGPGRGGRKRGR